jgi:hypothetical protein
MSPSIPAATHQVRLHFKVLEPPPKMNPAAMAGYMREVYAPHGIDVVVAPAVENLKLDVLKDLWVDDCMLGSPTEDQEKLFAHRAGVPANEICVYFIRSTVDDEAAGCASRATAPGFPNGRPRWSSPRMRRRGRSGTSAGTCSG